MTPMSLTTIKQTASELANIAAPGASFRRNALVIEAAATDAQIRRLGFLIADVADGTDWWRSDYLAEIKARYGADKAAKASQSLGIEQASFEFFSNIAAMFPLALRIDGLTFAHHSEAMLGCKDDPESALSWLQQAKTNEWTVSQLRRELRQAHASYKQDGRKPTGTGYSAVTDAERWACTQIEKANEYTPERARAVLLDLTKLRQFIEQISVIAARA